MVSIGHYILQGNILEISRMYVVRKITETRATIAGSEFRTETMQFHIRYHTALFIPRCYNPYVITFSDEV
jgi:hypothetical protein